MITSKKTTLTQQYKGQNIFASPFWSIWWHMLGCRQTYCLHEWVRVYDPI